MPTPVADDSETTDARSASDKTQAVPWLSILRGIALGMLAGIPASAFLSTDADLRGARLWFFLLFLLGFAAVGGIVGAVGKFPELVGLAAGAVIFTTLAVILGPMDGWMCMYIMFLGGAGVFHGVVIGGGLDHHEWPTG